MYVYTKVDTCAKFPLSKLILIFINCYQLLTAVDNLWQLIWKKLTGIFMYTLELKFVPNFGSLGWFSFSSTVISCWQLMTDDMKKINWHFYVHTNINTCAKYQLSNLIFIFINCYQLSSAGDSGWQLMTADIKIIQLEFLCTHSIKDEKYVLPKITLFSEICWQKIIFFS